MILHDLITKFHKVTLFHQYSKMATSLQNKLNDLEARLKAENEAKIRDKIPRDFNLGGGSPRRPKPCMYLSTGLSNFVIFPFMLTHPP